MTDIDLRSTPAAVPAAIRAIAVLLEGGAATIGTASLGALKALAQAPKAYADAYVQVFMTGRSPPQHRDREID